MGGVKYRHLKYEAAGDQYVGQRATGKYQISKIFSLSPAYFYSPHIDNLEQHLSMKLSINDWLWSGLPEKLQTTP